MPEAKPPVPAIGWVFEIDEGVARLRLLDAAGKSIRAQAPYHKPVKAGSWNHLTFTYDGSRTEDGYAFYLNGIRMPIERGSYGAQDSTIAPELKESVKNTAPLTIGADAKGEKGLDGSVGRSSASSTASSPKKKRGWPRHGRRLRRARLQMALNCRRRRTTR